MVTPVRGLLSEVLSITLKYQPNKLSESILNIILNDLKNTNYKNWQIYHGLLQCLFYVIPLNKKYNKIIIDNLDVILLYLNV